LISSKSYILSKLSGVGSLINVIFISVIGQFRFSNQHTDVSALIYPHSFKPYGHFKTPIKPDKSEGQVISRNVYPSRFTQIFELW